MTGDKSNLEAEIGEAISRFESEFMGRPAVQSKAYVIDDMILVRLKGVLTQAEHELSKSSEVSKGRELIKQVRNEMLEKGRPILEAAVETLTGKKVISLHADISTTTGERVILFTLDSPIA